MKLFNRNRLMTSTFLGVALSLSLHSSLANAEKMDADTHTLVIEKMETVLHSAKDDETMRLYPIRARLADLYAERARLRAMSEAAAASKAAGQTASKSDSKSDVGADGGADNGQDSSPSASDRRRALELYKQTLKAAPKA